MKKSKIKKYVENDEPWSEEELNAPLSAQTLKEIKQARKDFKEGRYFTHEQVLQKLGIKTKKSKK